MKYISVCSGIEAATVAWHSLGWQAAAYSEIEPFPSAVLAHHYPDVPNVGDMTKYKEWNIEPGTVDLLVGGTPCQSFSVAGLRKGLADPRGNLALVYCGILDHLKPRWFVWENVPGVLSSGGGRDFGSFLGAVAELGYGFAYRVLDAQYFGVAQRRRRVFVVGHLGDWRPAAKILFERESLRGDPAPSREAGEGVAARTGAGAAVSSGHGYWLDAEERAATLRAQDCITKADTLISQPYPVANTLTARMHKGINSTVDEGQTPVVTHSLRGEGFDASEDGTGPGTPLVPVAFHPTQDPISSIDVCHTIGAGNGQGCATAAVAVGTDCYNGTITGDVAATMGTPGSSINASGPTVMQPMAFDTQQITSATNRTRVEPGLPASTLAKAARMHVAVGAFKPGQSAAARSVGYEAEMAPSLEAGGGGNNKPAIHVGMQVRRLTPVECERLQGFPDNYTAIAWRKKTASECPDGPRYKALGNSMAVPVMAWIGRRINEIEG